jgi:hypothetical protein
MTSGACIVVDLALELFDHMLALAQRLLADAPVLGLSRCALAALAAGPMRSPMCRPRAPRKAQRHRHAHHQQRDPQHARAGKAQPAHRQAAQRIAQHAAGVARQRGLPAVQARPFQRATGRQQQHQAQPEHPARRQLGGWLRAAASRAPARQPGPQVTGTSHQAEKPNRKNSQIGHPGAERTGLVAQRAAVPEVLKPGRRDGGWPGPAAAAPRPAPPVPAARLRRQRPSAWRGPS